MAGSLNKVLLIGNLGKDPEVRTMSGGGKVVNLSIATSDSWKDRSTGEKKEKTEWHRVVIFNEHLGEVAEKYLKKGSTVYLEGSLQTRKWQNNQGQDVYTTEVVLQKFRGELKMLGGGSSSREGGYDDGGYGGTSYEPAAPRTESRASYDLNDDIPF